MFLEYLFELNQEYETNQKYGAYDLSDKFTVMLIGLLMIGSAATSYKYFINSPLICFAVNNPTGENFNEFATNYIWAAGSIPASVNNQSAVIENIDQWKSAMKNQGIHYYQWVPLILLLQSLTLLFCRYLWQSTASTNVSHNLYKLLSNCSAIPSTADRDKIKDLSSNLLSVINKNYSCRQKLKIKIQNKLSCFGFSRTLKNWISSNYIAYKILLICVCICQAIIINLIFDITPLDLPQILIRSDNSYIRNFPTSVIGFVPDVAVVGSYNSYTANCILSINLINEILFTLLQPLLICVAFINILSLISWIIDISIQYYRIDFIKKYLPESESENFFTDLQIFVDNYLKWDGVFVLKMMKKNCDNHLVREIINELWRTFHEENDCREIDAIPVDFLCSSDQIYTYLNTYIKIDGVVIIDPWITSEIISESGLIFDCVDLDLHKVKSAHLILAPVNIVNKCWMLFVYDVQSGSSYIFDPSQLPFEKSMITKFGVLFTQYLNKLSGKKNVCYELNENLPRVKQSTYNNSGPIVCGYAVDLVNDVPMIDPINVFKIRNIIRMVMIITKRWVNDNLL